MQPAFYDDAFRSYFASARQVTPGAAAIPQQQQPPPSLPRQPAEQDAFASFQQRLFAELNLWKRATANALSEMVNAAAASAPVPAPAPAVPPTMAAPPPFPAYQSPPAMPGPWQPGMAATYHPVMAYTHYSPPAAPDKPADAAKTLPIMITGNLPQMVLWIVLTVFAAIVLILIVVYLAKIASSLDGVTVLLSTKSSLDK